MQATFSVSERGSAVGVSLAGFATARAHANELAALRKNPGLPAGKVLPPGFLKNSDDQTVLGLAAVSRAMISLDRPMDSYQQWGVVAAPNFFGRFGTLQSFLNFRKDGAWGISPHLIPHHSLHAVSGTLSQALQIHGPNFGISGGPKAVAEAFLVAATMISENNLPGLWVVLSGHEPECVPQETDEQTPTSCLAAALALESLIDANSATSLEISGADNALDGDWPEFALADFLTALEAKVPIGRWMLPGCGSVILRGGDEEEQP